MNRTLALLIISAASALAADVKVSDLPAASALTGTELVQVVQTNSKKATVNQISAAAAASIAAANTYAPINSPTFTGTGTIPTGWTIADYLTSASAASTYLTQANAATTYQPKTAKLTAFSALADAAGLFASDGAGNYSWKGFTIGGNGAGDSGKVPVFDTNGSLIAQTYMRVTNGTNYTGIVTNGLSALKSSQFCSLNWPSSPTSARSATLPDASGTLYIVGQPLGTPSSGTATNLTGLPISTGLTGAGTGVLTALAVNVGSSGAFVVFGGALGTPSSGTLTNATGLPPAGVVGTAAILGSNTFTGAQTITTAGAVSAPVLYLSGTAYSGGTSTTTKPLVLIEPSGATSNAWTANGTMLGVNADSSFTGNLIDLQYNGTRYMGFGSSQIYMRAAEIRLAYNTPLYWGPSATVDIGLQRISGSALMVGGVGGATAWRVVGDGNGTGSTKYASLSHDGTNSILQSNFGKMRIVGTATNDAATTGDIGETTVSTVAVGSAVSLTNATGANVTSITLTAGDWDVVGVVNLSMGSATHTGSSAGISTTTATVPSDGSEGYNGEQTTILSTTSSVPICATRLSLASTTTVYLTVKSNFSAGTVGAFGKIRARRMR